MRTLKTLGLCGLALLVVAASTPAYAKEAGLDPTVSISKAVAAVTSLGEMGYTIETAVPVFEHAEQQGMQAQVLDVEAKTYRSVLVSKDTVTVVGETAYTSPGVLSGSRMSGYDPKLLLVRGKGKGSKPTVKHLAFTSSYRGGDKRIWSLSSGVAPLHS